MKCYTCKSEMKCIDDINVDILRVDFFRCEKCKSVAEVKYGNNGEYISTVNWKRDERQKYF